MKKSRILSLTGLPFFSFYFKKMSLSAVTVISDYQKAKARQLKSPNPTGVYVITPSELTESSRRPYTVLHWPAVLHHALNSPQGLKARQAAGAYSRKYTTLCRDDPREFEITWRCMKTWFEEHLPVGMRLDPYSSAPFIQQLVSLPFNINPDIKQVYAQQSTTWDDYAYRYFAKCDGDTTVLQPGILDFSAPGRPLRVLKDLQLYKSTELLAIPDTNLGRMPPILHLLVHTLRESERTRHIDAWPTWGLAWTSKGLLFNAATALAAYRRTVPFSVEDPLLKGDIYEDHVGQWSHDIPLDLNAKRGGCVQDLILAEASTSFFEVIDALSAGVSPSHVEKAGELSSYVSDISFCYLWDTAKLSDFLELARSPRYMKSTLKPTPMKREVLPLHFYDMEITTCKDSFYLAFPAELREHISFLNDRLIYRPGPKNTLAYKLRKSEVAAVETRCYVVNGTVFVHPALWLPTIALARRYLNTLSRGEDTYIVCTEILNNIELFCELVLDPPSTLKKASLTGELAYLFDQSPVPTDTFEQRMHLLLDRARHLSQEAVAFKEAKGPQDTRSKRINTYDTFLLWYAATHELPRIGYFLSEDQQAEYISKRLTWWRRPTPTRRYLQPVAYQGDTRITLDKVPSVEVALMAARRLFGESFTNGA